MTKLSGPRRKYGDVTGEEFWAQARREEGAYLHRSVTDEQRSLRRKGPLGTSPYLRLGPLSFSHDLRAELIIPVFVAERRSSSVSSRRPPAKGLPFALPRPVAIPP